MKKAICFLVLLAVSHTTFKSYASQSITPDTTIQKPNSMVNVTGIVQAKDLSEEMLFQLDSTVVTFYPYNKTTLLPGPIIAVKTTFTGTHPDDTGFPNRYTIALSNEYYYKVKAIPAIEFENGTGYPYAYRPQFYPYTEDIAEADFLDINSKSTEINFLFQSSEDRWNLLAGNVYNENHEMTYAITTAYRVVTDTNGVYSFQGFSQFNPFDSDFGFVSLPPGEYIIKVHPFFSEYDDGYYSDKGEIVPSWQEATRILINEVGEEHIPVYLKALIWGGEGEGEVSGVISSDSAAQAFLERNEYYSSPKRMGGVRIYLIDESGQIKYRTYTNNSGTFGISNIAAGNYTLFADKPGYSMQPFVFSVSEDGGSFVVDGRMNISSVTSVHETKPATTRAGRIYPNPPLAAHSVVEFPADGKPVFIQIINLFGKEIFKKEVETVPGQNLLTLDFNYFSTGIYRITISNGDHFIKMPPLTIVR